MENLWIMGSAAQSQGQPEVPAEPVGQNQTTAVTVAPAEPNTPHTGAAAGLPPRLCQLIFIVGIFVILYFIMFREPKKRQRQQQQMIQSLKKNDKVRTIGGIIA